MPNAKNYYYFVVLLILIAIIISHRVNTKAFTSVCLCVYVVVHLNAHMAFPLIQGLWLWLVQKLHFLSLNKSFWIQHPEYVYCHCLWNTLQLFLIAYPGVRSSITEQEQPSRSLHSHTLTELQGSETNSKFWNVIKVITFLPVSILTDVNRWH